MHDSKQLPLAKNRPLFTPGPLTTSNSVKQAMLHDLGAHDDDFIDVVVQVREGLLRVAGLSREAGWEVVPLQGSGSYGVEAVLTCSTPPDGKVLVLENGAYGKRIVQTLRANKIDHAVLSYAEDEAANAADVDNLLGSDAAITNVVVAHCETTSGIMNPIAEIGPVVRRHSKSFFVDSMSAFGAVETDFEGWGIDFLVSSANKCIEGVPGFSFIICRREVLFATEGWSRTLSFDLLDQWRGLESTGQFRFTPPIQVFLAFAQALRELEAEGGPKARQARYRANYDCLIQGMRRLGFEELLRPELQGHIITAFRYPPHPNFVFEEFFDLIRRRGYVIYLGKVVATDCFRIGNIGRLFQADIVALLAAIRETLEEMEVTLDRSE